MLASTASSPQTDLRLGDHKNPAASGTRFLLQLHHPGMASNPHRPSRLHRRLSHPPSSSAGRARTEQEDGEFIKRAFENLALDPSHALSSSTPLYTPSTGGSAFTSAGENADNATNNMESTAPTHYAYSTGSRMSIASTSSQPYSSLSGYTQVDRASIRSSQPLISHDPSDLSASPPSALPGRRRHFRAISSDNHKSNGESSNSSRPSLDSWRPDQNESIGNYTSGERRPTFSWFRPNLSIQPTSAIQAHDNGVWSDPFSEDFRERQLPRLRRSSTISGYSVNTSDWNSLRRGSLASLEHPSPTSATNNDGNNAATSYSYSLARSRNPSNNNGHEQATTATGDATPASAYANMARSQQSPTSLRWEAWAAAYRESLLQDVRNDRNAFYQQNRAARYLNHHPSISEETSGSILERHNHFYPLRRQFLARVGSRSESNRILVLELCHALEEYEMALGNLYRLAHSTSPHASLASLSASTLSTPSEIVARTSDSSIVEATLPPSSQHRTQLPSSLDKTQLERLADEVDSLVREIIEAVPAFSYSLSQGSYGPLPMRVKNQHSTAADITIQQYLEQVHILHPQYPTTHGLLAPHREHVASTSINPQVIPDLEQEGIDMSTWWPNRLRLDLRDGLLMDDVEDSPQISLGSSVLPTMPYRQEASGAESQIGPTTASHSRNGSSISIGQGEDAGRGRNDQLLAEGRRRWTEYLQGRQ